ncbi:MAG TPA: hypothetical protein VKA46_23995 [Gemmataceae bacterium]|nr:hypothetical protein [Gemmataceae bacterium]
MNGHPLMPVPTEELPPRRLAARLKQWAESQGYEFELSSHASEFGKVTLRDPDGNFTTTVIPNPHRGRRLRKDQVRYVVQEINNSWRN